MGNKLITLFSVCAFTCLLLLSRSTVAEQPVCLMCHQYPGLVRQMENGKLKVLHIDVAKYRASVHGQQDCLTCHLGVDKIPHVGENKTNCQSQCHRSEKDQALLAKTPRKDFHQKEQSFITQLDDKTSCKVCHQIYPHKKEPFIRTFLNMHTGYLTCEVCHLDRAKFTVGRYDWVQTNNVEFQGDPYGSFYIPLQQFTQTPQSTLSRIAPFVQHKEKLVALMNTWDTDNATKIWPSLSQLTEDKMAIELSHYHQDIVKMEHTRACEECHRANGMVDFRALGFSKEDSERLTNLNIGNIIKKYDIFYMPNINIGR